MSTFVGRTSELGLLQERYAAASAGTPQTVVVAGEAGVGKTALLDAFTDSIGEARVVTASGDEGETLLRFGVLGQLLGTRDLGWSDPFAAGVDLLREVDKASDPGPLVLQLDDAHLADPESLAAVTFALRRLAADRVMTVVAARVEEVTRLPDGLLRLAENQQSSIRLEGLTDDDVMALGSALGHRGLSHRAAVRLRRHTHGNPLYVRALLDELPSDRFVVQDELPAPQSYALLVLHSIATASLPARTLARAASVFGGAEKLAVIAAVAEVAAPETVLDELTASRMLTCSYDDDGWRIGFVHPLARTAIHEDLGPGERRRLHLRAADICTGDAALLHRVAAASEQDDALAGALAARAEELRRSGDLRMAAEFFLKAGRLSRTDGGLWLLEAATVFLIAGDVAAASAAESAAPDDAGGAARGYLRARIAWFGGRGALASILAQLHNMQGDGEGAAEWAERALAEDLTADVADITAAARAVGLMIAGRPRDALEALVELPEDPSDAAADQLHRLAARGALRGALGDWQDAHRDLAALLRNSPSDLAPERLLAAGVLAELEFRLGRWDSAVGLAEQALSLAEDSEQVWVQGYLHATAALVAAARGWWARTEAHLDAGHALAEQLGDPATWLVCQSVAVHVAMCRADPQEVVARSELLLALRGSPVEEPGWLGWPVQYASAQIQLGLLDEARETIARLDAVARERGAHSRLAALARLRGEVATASRDHTEARRAFREALDLSDAADALEWALIRTSYGRFLRRRGERRAARAQLQAAHDRLRVLGAAPFQQLCAEELAACGAPTEAATDSPLDVLTPQEQIVVRLAVEGLTNQDIARQLVLSAKTVGYHLGNAYTKLDVHSRAQLVTRVGSATGVGT